MLRFAPSPTGDMQIANLRVALFNFIVSCQKGEDLLIRIEDTDKETLEILSLFGIEYSQVIYRSQNVRFHSAMALQLLHEKKAFSCFCSEEWLQKKQKEAELTNEVYKYDDACRNLPPELVIDNTNPFTIRIQRPDGKIIIKDKIKGELSFKSDTVDSFVIMNQDKTATDNFACAIDDMLNDISIVIHEEEHLDNTPKQEHIRASLNYDKKIEYAHLPIILNEQNSTLDVKLLLKEGYLPEAISNYLISIGNKPPQKIFTTKEAVEWFDISQISNAPLHFKIDVLKDINREYLKNLEAKELSRYVGFADEEIGELARMYLEEADTTQELKSKITSIFEHRNIPEKFVKEIKLIKNVLKNAPYFEEYDDFKNHIIKETELTEESYTKPIRILLTNNEYGPDIAKIYKYIKNYLGEIVK